MRLCLLPLLLIATPAAAETDIRQILIDTAREAGCVITPETAEAVFPALGLTQDAVGAVAQEMVLNGEADNSTGSFVLSPEVCAADGGAAAPPVSPLMARVIEVFQAHGCTMDEATGMPALLAAGLTEVDLATLTGESDALVEAGLMIRDEATMTITITEPLCSAEDPEEVVIRMLSENGCALTEEGAAGLVDGYGITMEAAEAAAEGLVEQGLARVEGELLVLEGCGG